MEKYEGEKSEGRKVREGRGRDAERLEEMREEVRREWGIGL